jgi:3'-5' exoribonuclease
MRKNISELIIGETISGTYILKSHNIKLTRANKQYLDITLLDKTGTVSGKMWDMPENATSLVDGGFVNAVFLVSSYNDQIQIDVKGIAPLSSDALSLEEKAELIPCIDGDPEQLYSDLISIMESLTTPEYKSLVLDVLNSSKEQYISIPAAKSVHHAEIGGLLLHSLEVVKIIMDLHHAMPYFDKELCIIAGALHDIGKIKEFTLGETGLVADYSPKGQLLGHIFMGAEELGPLAIQHGFDEERAMLLQHMILSHHGQPDFGSAIRPLTLEAFILHEADDISAKSHVYMDAIKDLDAGAFSPACFMLDSSHVYKSKYQHPEESIPDASLDIDKNDFIPF